jgi:hypothetical protein
MAEMTATKAQAAGIGAGVGSALAKIISWACWQAGLDTSTIEAPMEVIISAILAMLTTYYAPANTYKPEQNK